MPNIEGRQPVLELLKAQQPINKLMVAQGEKHGSIHRILEMAKEQGVVVQEVSKQVLDGLSETRSHQGVIADISPVEYLELEDLIGQAQQSPRPPCFLVLDGIQDPQNLGSLLRSADAAGISGVIIPKRRAAAVTAVVAKASAGAFNYVPICRVTNLTTSLERLKEAGCWIAGADMSGQDYFCQDFTGPIALVIGSEGKGLSRLVRERCDFLVRIPMLGQVNSLNAGVAGAVLMFEVVRQRCQSRHGM